MSLKPITGREHPCPFCGCDRIVDRSEGGTIEWECETREARKILWQSIKCRVIVLERKVGEIYETKNNRCTPPLQYTSRDNSGGRHKGEMSSEFSSFDKNCASRTKDGKTNNSSEEEEGEAGVWRLPAG